MRKVQVEICCGTACYLLGASQMMDMEDALPEELRGRVEILPRTCLGLCERENIGKAPFVRFGNGEVMSDASLDKVLDRVRQLVEENP